MRPHPRIRRTILWAGLGLAFLSLAALGLSRRWVLFWGSDSGRLQIGLFRGQFVVIYTDDFKSKPGFELQDLAESRILWGARVDVGPRETSLWLPLWGFTLVGGALASVAGRFEAVARRRARVGLCPACGYNRAGLPTGAACPECGAAPKPAPAAMPV